MHSPLSPPKNQAELMQRAVALAGLSIGEVAQAVNFEVPANLKQKKGWQGQFIEAVLGADSGNLSQPDFNHLGIELKTLPIDYSGKVLESTYVCVLNLNQNGLQSWEQSAVFKKLNHVLWVPVAKSSEQSVFDYQIATPFLWQPNRQQQQILQQDWEDAMELVALGKADKLNAKNGQFLQVRPKAAHSRVLTKTVDRDGQQADTLPRGFYLRSSFTQSILNRHLKLG